MNGNTQSKYWCATINNYTALDIPDKWPDVHYCIWQAEEGEGENTPHLQIYVVFKTRKRFSTVKKLHPQAHWEYRKGSHQQAKDYCQKTDTRIAGPWTKGDDSDIISQNPGQRNDLIEVQRALDGGISEAELVEKYFAQSAKYLRFFREYKRIRARQRNWKTHVIVIWGPTGTGKSKYCLDNYPDAYWKPQSDWWDGYEGQDTIIIDEFYGWLPYSSLLRILDRYPLVCGTKFGHTAMLAKTIVITSNKHPIEWYAFGKSDKYDWPAFNRRLDQVLHFTTPYIYEEEPTPPPTTTTSTTTLDCDEQWDESPPLPRPPPKCLSRVYSSPHTLNTHLSHGYQSPVLSPILPPREEQGKQQTIKHSREDIRRMSMIIEDEESDDEPLLNFNLFKKMNLKNK